MEQRACETDETLPDSSVVSADPSPREGEIWITPREAAKRAGIPTRTLYNWIRAGKWPVRVYKYSESTYQVKLDEFEAWLTARQAERDA